MQTWGGWRPPGPQGASLCNATPHDATPTRLRRGFPGPFWGFKSPSSQFRSPRRTGIPEGSRILGGQLGAREPLPGQSNRDSSTPNSAKIESTKSSASNPNTGRPPSKGARLVCSPVSQSTRSLFHACRSSSFLHTSPDRRVTAYFLSSTLPLPARREAARYRAQPIRLARMMANARSSPFQHRRLDCQGVFCVLVGG